MFNSPQILINRALVLIFIIASPALHAAPKYPAVTGDRKAVYKKFQQIILAKVELKDVSLAEAVDILREKVEKSDAGTHGLNIILEPPIIYPAAMLPKITVIPGISTESPAPAAVRPAILPSEMKVTVSLENVSLMKALETVAQQGGCKCQVDPFGVAIVPWEQWEGLAVTEYKVPAKFFTSIREEKKDAKDVRPLLESMGIESAPGTAATYIVGKETLAVRQTEQNFDLIDKLILEEKLPAEKITPPEEKPEYAADSPEGKKVAALRAKLHKIIIPKLEFRDATVREAVDFLKRKSVELDDTVPPRKPSSVFTLVSPDTSPTPTAAPEPPAAAADGLTETKITLSLTDIPLDEAMRYVARMANLKVKIEPDGVQIVPLFESAKAPAKPAAERINTTDIRRIEGGSPMLNKVNTIIIPKVDFHEVTAQEAIEFLAKKSVELDTAETDPKRKGVRILLRLVEPKGLAPSGNEIPSPAIPPGEVKISLSLTNVPLGQALRYVTGIAGLKLKMEPYMITVIPLAGMDDNDLFTKEYLVPTKVFAAAFKQLKAREYLEQRGVKFTEGTSAAVYLPASQKLVVRNSQENMNLVDKIVTALTGTPKELESQKNEADSARAQESIKNATVALSEGDKALKEKHYDVAVTRYQLACDTLRESAASKVLRERAMNSFGEATVKMAESQIAAGDFVSADETVDRLLLKKYNPDYEPALHLRASLEDPNSRLYKKTPKSLVITVQKVKMLFLEARKFSDSGQYNLAKKRYQQILEMDPYNATARKEMEKVNAALKKPIEEGVRTIGPALKSA